jgi:anti-anti-sigma factor
MRRECKIKVHEGKGIATIEIVGDLTVSAGRDMDAARQEAYGYNPSGILVKLDGRNRISSTGMAMLINLAASSRDKGCKVYFTGVSQHFRKIFRMVGLTKYAEIVDSVEEMQTGNLKC